MGKFLLSLLTLLVVIFFWPKNKIANNYGAVIIPSPIPSPLPSPTPLTIKDSLDEEIDFSPQAPFANWKDPRQQDACEEAAVLMAVYHRQQKPLTKETALKEILAISQWQTDTYGEYRDTSAADTAKRLLSRYFRYDNYQVINDISKEEIILELNKGNLIIAPTNGRALKNPYFTPPGPERHMVVIKGYDNKTDEFITNDPGVGNGKNFRYPQNNLYEAIRDYSTGYHVPIPGTEKNVISVGVLTSP